MLSDTEIIKADIGHAFEVHDLELNSFDTGKAWTLKMVLDGFNSPNFKCYILRRFDEIVGYIAYLDLGGEYEIQRLVVSKEWRRYGCATRLLQFVANLADINMATDLILDVSHLNQPALFLYTKFGFYPDGLRKQYYGREEDAVLMRKKI
ncbi:MAG: GNAT family N-acetyltransferase [Firmicutes bacterium]|nr:GNAT family N-acetyltransferase [Bacillota bacterium]